MTVNTDKILEVFRAPEISASILKGIIDLVEEGFIVVDRSFKIIIANKAYCDQLGLEESSVIGKNCYAISHRLNKPCYEIKEECSVKFSFDTGKPHASFHVHTDKDRNPVYIETKSFPLKDSSGEVTLVVELINNVTGRKKLEDQLRHAQKMEAVGTLAGGIAHDFNNILTAIMGYGHILQLKMEAENPLKGYADSIITAAERGANLTSGLLAFSRKQIIDPQLTDVNDIVRKVEKLLARLIGEDIELKTDLADKRINVVADSGQIEQVLMNLASNARDAMPDGGIISIKTSSIELDERFLAAHEFGAIGDYAIISVSDTGTGMDKTTAGRIFEPFFTTKEVGKGTGLGLAMAYGIIKQHNGFMTVYSELGIGTTFKIYLPTSNSGKEVAEVSKVDTPKGGTETVMIAEDDHEVRKINSDILREFGYTIIEAIDGVDAVEKFRSHMTDIKLVILDVIMPHKNGKEAYHDMQKLKPDVKAIFTSGYTSDIISKKGILEEGINFVPKPVPPQELLLKVREVLDS
ncbi:MAG: response regulator [Nitrospirae bacterium]|nr:response regulator [Nitrospirota bacterium]